MFFMVSWFPEGDRKPHVDFLPLNDLITTAQIFGYVAQDRREFEIYQLENGQLTRIFPLVANQLNLSVDEAEAK